MIDTQTQPNIPYIWELSEAIRRESDRLLADKRERGSTLIVERAVSLQPRGVAGGNEGLETMQTTRRYKTVTCPSCDVLVINNHICHEHGCPDAWRDETRECAWCGSTFKPDDRHARFCCEDCAASYNS